MKTREKRLPQHWLMKSEPATFGIDDLAGAPRRRTIWNGVRNYQVRNMLRDDFRRGDLAFFYHSSCPEPGIYGAMRIVRAGHPEAADPRWYQVEVQLLHRFAQPVLLATLREHADGPLQDLLVLRRGNRLSITPVTDEEWNFIHRLAAERSG